MEKLSMLKIGSMRLLLVTLIDDDEAVSEPESPSLALRGYQEHCGSIRIPYPFGIGKNCSKNEWYRILCNTTGAFLQSLQRELTDITLGDSSYRGKIQIKVPVVSSGCSSQRRSEVSSSTSPLNLKGSPFFLSQQNKLTVVGCNITALMTDTEPEIIGCETTCDPTRPNKGGDEAVCSGYKCCQTRIPVDLHVKCALDAEQVFYNLNRDLKFESCEIQEKDFQLF